MSPIFRLASRLAALWLALCAAGCAHFSHAKKEPKNSKKKPQAEVVMHRLVGTIAMVNAQNHFVLVNVGTVAQPPPAESKLQCVRGGVKVGALVATGDQNPPFIVANIVSGSLQQGDAVEKIGR